MKVHIFENGVLIAEDSVINGVWSHRWFDNSTNKFKKDVNRGRLKNFYPWNKWVYVEVK